MTDFKLYAFDLDGTLIANHLTDVECPVCHGSGVDDSEGRHFDGQRCPRCHGRKTVLDTVPEGFDHIEVLPKVQGRLFDLWTAGKRMAIITNQGGVSMKFQTEEQVFDKVANCYGDLALHVWGPRLSFHVAFDYPKGPEPYRSMPMRRKPNATMLHEAMTLANAGPSDTIFVGDLDTDREAAERANVAYQHPKDFFGWE